MSTRPLDPPPFIADDPGPWSVVTQLVRSRGGRPGRRYAEPPRGLMLAQPPRIDVALTGLDEGLDTLGGTDPELQRAVLQRMATLHEDKLGDAAASVDAYRRPR